MEKGEKLRGKRNEKKKGDKLYTSKREIKAKQSSIQFHLHKKKERRVRLRSFIHHWGVGGCLQTNKQKTTLPIKLNPKKEKL